MSYRGQHEAPCPGSGAPIFDLCQRSEIYPEDVYGGDALRLYSDGDTECSMESIRVLHDVRNAPQARVTIFRAVPRAPGEVLPAFGILRGDWVSLSESYALKHGRRWLSGQFWLLRSSVKAKEVFADGNSINELGYQGEDIPARVVMYAVGSTSQG